MIPSAGTSRIAALAALLLAPAALAVPVELAEIERRFGRR